MSNYKRSSNPLNLTAQAARVIAKFGTAGDLSKALDKLGDLSACRHRTTIYKWTWPKAKGGTGGLIPADSLNAVVLAARLEGILLTPDDLYGRLG